MHIEGKEEFGFLLDSEVKVTSRQGLARTLLGPRFHIV